MQLEVTAFMSEEEITAMVKMRAQGDAERQITEFDYEYTTDENGKPRLSGARFRFGKKISNYQPR